VVQQGASRLPLLLLPAFEAESRTDARTSQAAGHGNEDAKQRLDALQQSNPAALNRTDHDAHLENKLVRKRTQAKVRSDAQRDRLAANQLNANLSGARLSSSQGPSGPRPPQINVPAAQAQYQPYRQSTAGSTASSSSSYRRNTIKQVEAAVQMAPPPPSTPNPMRPPPQQQHMQQQQQHQRYPSPGPPRPQSYQLSDAPPSSLPTTQRPQQQTSRPQTIPVSQQLADQHKPATFAEMVRPLLLPFSLLSRPLADALSTAGHQDESS